MQKNTNPSRSISSNSDHPSPDDSSAQALAIQLSGPQQKAIEQLAAGSSLVESATAAGVNRTTLYRWLRDDARFQAAYNAWQADVLSTARGRILNLADTAVTAVEKALLKGDSKAALMILKSIGLLDRPTVGSTDPEEIAKAEQIKKVNRKNRLDLQAEMAAMLG